jgi:hypothetical protein
LTKDDKRDAMSFRDIEPKHWEHKLEKLLPRVQLDCP